MFKNKLTKANKAGKQRQQEPVSKQDYFNNCHRTYSCIHCRAHLANHDELVSKLFQGNHGRAYLFNKVVNIGCKKAVERELLTGLHAVADIYCDSCETTLGWKYEQAYVPSQKYKEGKYIIELVHMLKENNWDLTSYNARELLDEAKKQQLESITTSAVRGVKIGGGRISVSHRDTDPKGNMKQRRPRRNINEYKYESINSNNNNGNNSSRNNTNNNDDNNLNYNTDNCNRRIMTEDKSHNSRIGLSQTPVMISIDFPRKEPCYNNSNNNIREPSGRREEELGEGSCGSGDERMENSSLTEQDSQLNNCSQQVVEVVVLAQQEKQIPPHENAISESNIGSIINNNNNHHDGALHSTQRQIQHHVAQHIETLNSENDLELLDRSVELLNLTSREGILRGRRSSSSKTSSINIPTISPKDSLCSSQSQSSDLSSYASATDSSVADEVSPNNYELDSETQSPLKDEPYEIDCGDDRPANI